MIAPCLLMTALWLTINDTAGNPAQGTILFGKTLYNCGRQSIPPLNADPPRHSSLDCLPLFLIYITIVRPVIRYLKKVGSRRIIYA
jgi:hypothetical protein